MSIIVVCPGCLKSFNVNDKFAGKTGPCPNCKRTLQIPTKDQEVKVHAPEAFAGGGKSVAGKLVTKPVARSDAKFRPMTTAIIAASVVVVFVATWLGRPLWALPGMPGLVAKIVGLLLISPPLVVAAYEVLRDDELEPYRGNPLYIRAASCGVAYAVLWGLFAILVSMNLVTGELWNWIFVVPPLVALGGAAAFASLDLDFGNGVCHYGFYLLVTVILRWVAGMGWVWHVTS